VKRSTLEKKSTKQLCELRDIIAEILAARAGQPTEKAIPGGLLREFESGENWPDGYSYKDDPLFLTDDDAEPDGTPFLVDDQFYDMTGVTLERDDPVEIGTKPVSYWSMFKKWYAKAYPPETGA
jgi:hypothetical protein